MPDNIVFELKRHEAILSSLVKYFAGNTTEITDFSEGSIARSLLEAVAQEIYRQNLTYAQGIITGVPAAIRAAFNLPLLDATKASGQFTATRQMLPPPSINTVQFTSASAQITGYISGTTLTVRSKSGTLAPGMVLRDNGVALGTYLQSYVGTAASPNIETWTLGPGCSFTGAIASNILTVTAITSGSIAIGMAIDNTTGTYQTSGIIVQYFITGTGGIGTYYVSGSASFTSTSLYANSQIVGTTSNTVTFNLYGQLQPVTSLAANTTTGTGLYPDIVYYYSAVPVSGNFSSGFTEGIASPPVSVTSGAVSSATITWNKVSGSSGIRLYRSTSLTMQNASYVFIPNYSTSALPSTNSNAYQTSYTENLYTGSNYTINITAASNGVITDFSGNTLGTNYSVGNCVIVSGGNNNAIIRINAVNASTGAVSSANIVYGGSGYSIATGSTTTIIKYVSNRWPGSLLSYAVSATNLTNGQTAETIPDVQNVYPNGSVANITWKPTSAIDATGNPTGYKIYKAQYNVFANSPQNLLAYTGSATSNLNYGFVSTSTNPACAVQQTLIIPSAHVTIGSMTASQILNASSGLTAGTFLVASTPGYTAGTVQKWLISQPQTATSGINASASWTVTSNAVASVAIGSGGSGYAVGNVLLLPGGDNNAYIKVNSVNSGAISGIDLISAGSGYTAQSTATGLTAGAAILGLNGTSIYYYRVSAIFSGGESAPSQTVAVSTDVTNQVVYLQWDAVLGAMGYRVYRSSFDSMRNAKFYDVTDNFFTDNGTIILSSSASVDSLPSTKFLGTSSNATTYSFADAGNALSSTNWKSVGTAFSKQGVIVIPGGTKVGSNNNAVTYKYISDTVMPASAQSVTSIIQCEQYGIIGNATSNALTKIFPAVYGISGGTNLQPIINGKDVETDDEWKLRFSQSLQKNARGTADAILAGAVGTKIYDNNGFVLEKVSKAFLYEPSAGTVYLYIHNNTISGPSATLVQETQQVINGYTMPNGDKVPGYKSAGIPVIVFAATTVLQPVNIVTSLSPGMTLPVIRSNLKDKIYEYFYTLDIGDGLYKPTITSVTPNGTTGSTEYRYAVVAIDSSYNYSEPSSAFVISNGNAVVNNTITWPLKTGGPTISSYDVLRHNGYTWALVANVPTSGSYYNSVTNVMTYTDTVTYPSQYGLSGYSAKYLKKSELVSALVNLYGISALSLTLPSPTNNSITDQDYVQPSRGVMLMPGTILVN